MDVCGPCKFRNLDNKAIKYCLTCEEPQCKTCSDIHASSKATKKHLLIAITELSHASKTHEDLQTFQNCKDHSEKRLEYFCTDHEHFLCSTCLLNIQDLDCNCIAEVETAGEQLISSKFNERISKDLEHVTKYCREQEDELQSIIDKSFSNKAGLIKYIEEIKQQVINRFEKCKINIENEIDKTVKEQVTELKSQQTVLREARQMATENNDILQKIVSNNSTADCFRCLVSVMEQLDKLPLNKMSTETEIRNHTLEMSPILYSLIKSDESYPLMQCKTTKHLQTTPKSFHIAEDRRSFINETKKVAHTRDRNLPNDYTCSSSDADMECSGRNSKEMKLKVCDTQQIEKSTPEESFSSNAAAIEGIGSYLIHLSDNVVTTPDGKQPEIVDIIKLPDNSIVLSDRKWSRLLRIKTNLTYTDTAELSHPPGNMTVLNERFLALCLPTGNRIAFVSISSEFKWMRNFKTLHAPRCVHALDNSRLLVSMKDPTVGGKWYLQIVSTDGALKQDMGKTRFIADATLISSFKLTPSSPRFYLQCSTVSDTLFCYDVNGRDIFRYTVSSPRFLYIDKSQKIYVLDSCGQLHILANDGKLLQVFNVPTELNGLTYSSTRNTLLFTKKSSATISVYEVRLAECKNTEQKVISTKS